MVGQGAALPGGVRHIAVLKRQSQPTSDAWWGLPELVASYYRCPTYVNQLPPLSTYTAQYADAVDGKRDGTWRGHSIQGAHGGFDTPARIPYQTRAIQEVIEREHLGQHAEPDLLFLNYKIIDEIGHEYFADSPEMDDTVKVQDEFLGNLVSYLNHRFPHRYALLVTADHGHTSHPARTGGTPLSINRVHSLLEAQFDADGDSAALVPLVRPYGFYVNGNEQQQNHVTASSMSKYLSLRTNGDLAKDSPSPHGAAFDAVFAGSVVSSLDC
jgi:predicted AlkP superfamily pyrophosphatase or phosphodiesterase